MVDRATLEYYICERGEEATMALFKLTQKQMDTAIYGKPLKENKTFTFKEKEYIPYTPSNSPDLVHLERVINENYSQLFKGSIFKKWNINTRSLTQEDIFQDGLLRLLKGADTFTYVDDETTLRFIKHALKADRINAIEANRTAIEFKSVLREIVNSESQESYYDENPIDNLRLTEPLTDREKAICELFKKGYNQTEIAENIGVTKQVIFKQKKRIQEKIIL